MFLCIYTFISFFIYPSFYLFLLIKKVEKRFLVLFKKNKYFEYYFLNIKIILNIYIIFDNFHIFLIYFYLKMTSFSFILLEEKNCKTFLL